MVVQLVATLYVPNGQRKGKYHTKYDMVGTETNEMVCTRKTTEMVRTKLARTLCNGHFGTYWGSATSTSNPYSCGCKPRVRKPRGGKGVRVISGSDMHQTNDEMVRARNTTQRLFHLIEPWGESAHKRWLS